MTGRPGRATAPPQGDPPASYADGARAGLPFAISVFAVGISFGVLATEIGWGPVAPIVISAVVFSGSAQFALATVLGGGGSAAAAVLAALLVNLRYLPMGLAIAPSLLGGRWRRALEAQAVVDSSWVLAARRDGTFDRRILIGSTVPQYLGWVAGTAVGAFGVDLIRDPAALGLDALFPAFFLVLLAEDLRRRRARVVAALGAVIALVLIPVSPVGVPVLVAAGAALLGVRRP